VVLGKMKNEDSRGLRRLYKGRNYVPKFQGNFHRSKHLKRRRNMHFGTWKSGTCAPGWMQEPGAWRYNAHAPGAWNGALGAWRRFSSKAHAPRAWPKRAEHGDLRKKLQFCDVFALLAQVQVEIFPVNTALLIHNFSFRTGSVQEEGDSRSFRRNFSIFSLFSRVCFYLFVICL